MGGHGSGYFRPKKDLVENHVALDIHNFRRDCPLRPGVHNSGMLRWMRGDCETASIGYIVYCNDEDQHLTLHYRIDEKYDVRTKIGLARTTLVSGGNMWWLLCPECQSRRRKLYLVRGYFICRACADLTYESSQTAKHFAGLYKTLAKQLGVDIAEFQDALTSGRRNKNQRKP